MAKIDEKENSNTVESRISPVKDNGKEQFFHDFNEKQKWLAHLKDVNANITDKNLDDEKLRSLDSSLKRNTAFIRKLKTTLVNSGNADNVVASNNNVKVALLAELSTLNLKKYLSEVASALVNVEESKMRQGDVKQWLEIATEIHLKFGSEFKSHLENCWIKYFKDITSSASSELDKVKLRTFVECHLIGLVSSASSSSSSPLHHFSLIISTHVLSSKRNQIPEIQNLSLILSILKHCGFEIFGLFPVKFSHSEIKMTGTQDKLRLDEKRQKVYTSHLLAYYKHCCDFVVKGMVDNQMNSLSSSSNISSADSAAALTVSANWTKMTSILDQIGEYLPSGEHVVNKVNIRDEVKKRLQSICESTYGSNVLLCDSMMSPFDDDNGVEIEGEPSDAATSAVMSSLLASHNTIWEDDETRQFYMSLLDLRVTEEEEEKEEEGEHPPTDEKKEEKEDEQNDFEDMNDEIGEDLNEEIFNDDLDDDIEDECLGEDSSNVNNFKSNKEKMNDFFDQLHSCFSRESVDEAAQNFASNLNIKPNRKRLVKKLFGVYRNRSDMQPFMARLVATLQPVAPDLSIGLAKYLKSDFVFHVKKKDQTRLEVKLKLCRFIGETVKFNIFPKSDALFCIRLLLTDFSHHQLEMLCVLLESCGRFLYRSIQSHKRMRLLMEQLERRKQRSSLLDERYLMQLENAQYVVMSSNSSSLAADADHERSADETGSKSSASPIQLYIKHLIQNVLNKSTVERVIRQLRKLDWSDTSFIEESLIPVLCDVGRVKYVCIPHVASVISGLVSYHEWIACRIVDETLERIRRHMELNDVRLNQERVSTVKLFGELYIYRIIDSSLVLNLLYSFISYQMNDSDEDVLRIRLVCVIIDSVGGYFSSEKTRKKLDYFLIFFQHYYWMKRSNFVVESSGVGSSGSVFPYEVGNIFSETLNRIRPKMRICESLEEAESEVKDLEKKMVQLVIRKVPDLSVYVTPQLQEGGKLDSLLEEEEEIGGERSENDEQVENKGDERLSLSDSDVVRENPTISSNSNSCNSSDEFDDTQVNDGEEETETRSDDSDDHANLNESEDFEEDTTEEKRFQTMLDNMMHVSSVGPSSTSSASINLPVHIQGRMRKQLMQKGEDVCSLSSRGATEDGNTNDGQATVKFAMMVRGSSSAASSYKTVALPSDSEVVRSVEANLRRDEKEKAEMKQLTLNISSRQQQQEHYDDGSHI